MKRDLPTDYDVASSARSGMTWRTSAIAIGACIACVLALYGSTARGMVEIWTRSDTFAHGYVVVPISLWLVWSERAEIARAVPRPAWWPLVLLAAAGAAWLAGELASVNAVTQLALVAMVVCVVVALVGGEAARSLAFPLAFLFFAVPIGEFVMPRLMEWTADVTVLGLRLTGIPVYREGQQFVIPSGRWSVVEACSGVRYLIASLMVGTLFAHLAYRSARRRIAFIAFAVAVPIVANWMRAYIIVMLGHLSDNKVAAGADHLIYGWAFFGIVMAILFFAGARWREDRTGAAVTASAAAPAAGRKGRSVIATAALCVAVAAVWKLAFVAIEHADAASAPQLALVQPGGGWQRVDASRDAWRPRFENPAAETNAIFSDGTARVGLFVAYYRNQGYTSKLVSSENVLVTTKDKRWAQVKSGARSVDAGGRSLEVRSAELKGASGERMVVWSWYWIAGRTTTSDHVAKAYTALSRLRGEGDDSAAVIVYATGADTAQAVKALESFVAASEGPISAALSRTRSVR